MSPLEPEQVIAAPLLGKSDSDGVHAGAGIQVRPLPVLLAGTFVIVLDFFIVNVMLPSIERDLPATASDVEWVVASYGIPFAACLITGARLGDYYGRRRVLCFGLALFSLASGCCAAAPTPGALIAARVVQGFGAALISPNVLSIIGVLYVGAERVRALRSYALVMGLAAVGGQVLGGLLLGADVFGLQWRACFLVAVPVSVSAMVLARAFVPESQGERPERIDLLGMGLVSIALIALVLPLIQGRELGWPWWTWFSLGCVVPLLWCFIAYQRTISRRDGSPLFDPAALRERVFAAGLLTQVTYWCGQASFFLVLALYLQQGRGLSALQAGAVFAILAAAFVVASLRAPLLTTRFGREVVAGGALVLAAGHLLLLLALWRGGAHASIALLGPGLILAGVGQGLCITPLASIVMSRLDPARAGAASGSLSTMQQVGNSIGVAVTGLIFFGVLRSGFTAAFEASVAQLAALSVLVAVLTRLLPVATSKTCESQRVIQLAVGEK